MTGTIAPLKYEGTDPAGQPIFSMNKVNDAYPTQTYDNHLLKAYSRCWRILFGIKYMFN